MTRTLSVSVTPEQYDIIKKIATKNKCSVSKLLKESLQTYIALYYVTDILSKLGFNERTQEEIERDAKIMEHAEEMTKLMQPYFEKILSAIPPEVIKVIEEEGNDFEITMKGYSKPIRRGRRPQLTTNLNKETV